MLINWHCTVRIYNFCLYRVSEFRFFSDYAADYAGGDVISILETTPYPTSKIMQLFGFFRLTYSSSPREIVKPSTIPGDCFRFYGSKARIIIKLGKKIGVGSVTMEHSPLLEDFSDAPKNFKVFVS